MPPNDKEEKLILLLVRNFRQVTIHMQRVPRSVSVHNKIISELTESNVFLKISEIVYNFEVSHNIVIFFSLLHIKEIPSG